MNDFGKLLKTLRKKKSWSQATLAEQLSISAASISKWENNSAYPDVFYLRMLSELFQISCDDLLHPTETLQKLEASPNDTLHFAQDSSEEAPVCIEEPCPPKRKKLFHSRRFYICSAFVFLLCSVFCIDYIRKPAFTLQETRRKVDSPYGKSVECIYTLNKYIPQQKLSDMTVSIEDDWREGKYPEWAEDILILRFYNQKGEEELFFVFLR